ncbi:MAG TPA: transposase [Gemmataceae bacterium]|nr:transposase [Gemmataceae bacterium]
MTSGDFPLAYFLTWTTYATWLPGDERGWVKKGTWSVQAPDPTWVDTAERAVTESPVILTLPQRKIVDDVLVKHCQMRRWHLHARNVRTNHVHAVVTAAIDGEIVRSQLKAWSSRRLSEHAGLSGQGKNGQKRWWTEGGDIEWVRDDEHLYNVIRYVAELQDHLRDYQ